MNSFNYLKDHILYQIFKNILNILSKNMKKILLTYLRRSTSAKLKEESEYYIEVLTPGTMSLFGRTKAEMTKKNMVKMSLN